jgi:hypothetical protein
VTSFTIGQYFFVELRLNFSEKVHKITKKMENFKAFVFHHPETIEKAEKLTESDNNKTIDELKEMNWDRYVNDPTDPKVSLIRNFICY